MSEHLFKPGKSGNPNGRPPGTVNKATSEFKELLNKLLEESAPKMLEWLERVAATNPEKALDTIGKLAEYIHPKLSRAEMTGKDGKDLIPPSVELKLVRPDAARDT